MVFVFLSLHIILKEDLNLIVHLGSNILKEAGGNHSKATKPKRRKCDLPACDISTCIISLARWETYLTPST